jgi:hypothetical protein
MKPFEVQDVTELLRREIDRVGSQSQWARQAGVQRSLINKVINGRRLPTSRLCRALGLKWVIVRHRAGGDDEIESGIVSKEDVLGILSEQIKLAGSITAWCEVVGEERTYVSRVLHKRELPSKKILLELGLSEVLVRANESDAARNCRPQNRTGKRHPHARW